MSEENFTYSEWPFFSCSWVRRTFASEPYFEISSGRRPREISKGSQANFLLTNEQEKKEVTNVIRWNFFHKKETIILTEYFFKFTGVFRVCNHGENLKNQKWLFYFTIEKTCKIKKWLFSSLSEVKFYFTQWSKIFPHWVKKKVKVALNRSSTENSGP